MAGIVFYLSDDVTAADTLTFNTSDGVASSTVILHPWNDKGGSSSAFIDNVRMMVRIEDPNSPGDYLSSGHEALDGHHFQARLVGASIGNPAMPVMPSGDWFPLGAGSMLELGKIYGNSSRYVEVRYYPPLAEGAAQEDITVKFSVVANNTQYGVPNGLMEGTGQGILTGITDGRISETVRAPTITATGTPDDEVHVAGPDEWVYCGVPYAFYSADEAIELNQNDSAAAALTTGKSYIAIIVRPWTGGAASAIKGLGATSPTAPTIASTYRVLGRVVVGYGASGSVINSGAITMVAKSGRAAQTSSSGSLTVTIGSFRLFAGGAYIVFGSSKTFALPASSTTRVWVSTSGDLRLVTTDDNPPSAGAEHLYTYTTDGTGVTAVVDKRRFLAPGGIPISLFVAGNETAAAAQAYAMIPFRWSLDKVVVSFGTAAAGGATGTTLIDINKRSGGTTTTLFTNQGGASETRPAIAAGGYTDLDCTPEVRTGEAGDLIILDVDAITSGGTRAANLGAVLWVYPR